MQLARKEGVAIRINLTFYDGRLVIMFYTVFVFK